MNIFNKILYFILLSEVYSILPILEYGTKFLLTLTSDEFNSVLKMYSSEQNDNVFPEAENSTIIVTGLPGTRFQRIIDQNIADTCIPRIQCNRSAPYRSINGSCNNLIFPMWGLTGTALVRLVPALYEDGVHQTRMSVTGRPLSDVQYLRNKLLPNKKKTDNINTLTVMEWGQIISHDTTHIPVLPVSRLGRLQCCINNSYPSLVTELPAQCMPIRAPTDDVYFSRYNQTCLNFVRAITTTDYGCSLVPHQQNIELLAQYYVSIDGFEFYIAGLMEEHVDGALTGPTFQCILGEQFARWRNGDRFYYQFSYQTESFTPAQYQQLQKIRLSLIFCCNGDNITNMQPNVFYRPTSNNRLVPCSELPHLDLTPWKEKP